MIPFAPIWIQYREKLNCLMQAWESSAVLEELTADLQAARQKGTQVFTCGNGGSGGNAAHWANDLVYPITQKGGRPIRTHALTANPSVLTCLGNDIGYENVFAYQLGAYARQGDILIAMSGSGNSPNILRVLEKAKTLGVKSYAILGFDGGQAKGLADCALHFEIDDMQIAEDIQMVLCHTLTQYLNTHTS